MSYNAVNNESLHSKFKANTVFCDANNGHQSQEVQKRNFWIAELFNNALMLVLFTEMV